MNPILHWDAGIGWIENPPPFVYDQAYMNRYAALAATPIGRRIIVGRLRLVERYVSPTSGGLLDVGIGSGAFLEAAAARGWTVYGDDVNPAARGWLEDHGYTWRGWPVAVATYWDSLEHIQSPWQNVLCTGARWVFISTPVYSGPDEVRRSKHCKPGEHLWYFSPGGLIRGMGALGYQLRLQSDWESSPTIGRESIGTFVFEKTACNES